MAVLFVFLESTGFLAPLVFIILHLVRPILLIPVQVICIIGGILFGALFGTLYSLIGLTVLCVVFYIIFSKMPKTLNKVIRFKEKWLGNHTHFTIGQIAILRLLPFINFHLLSICLVDVTRNFRQFLKGSIVTNIPVALFYTVFGQFISEFSIPIIMAILLSLTLLFYLLRERQVVIGWHEFFKPKTRKSSYAD